MSKPSALAVAYRLAPSMNRAIFSVSEAMGFSRNQKPSRSIEAPLIPDGGRRRWIILNGNDMGRRHNAGPTANHTTPGNMKRAGRDWVPVRCLTEAPPAAKSKKLPLALSARGRYLAVTFRTLCLKERRGHGPCHR